MKEIRLFDGDDLGLGNGLFAELLADTGPVRHLEVAILGQQHVIVLADLGEHGQGIPLQALVIDKVGDRRLDMQRGGAGNGTRCV